jgi:hypothetical protein
VQRIAGAEEQLPAIDAVRDVDAGECRSRGVHAQAKAVGALVHIEIRELRRDIAGVHERCEIDVGHQRCSHLSVDHEQVAVVIAVVGHGAQ